jgi:hypothetical protein
VTGQHQSEAIAGVDDFTGLEVDVLFEEPMEKGVFTAEGAFYSFDYGSSDAKAFYVWAGWLFKNKTGPGQFQPIARYQSWDGDDEEINQIDAGLNYVIAGDNARLHATYSHLGGDADGSAFQLGAQLQF